MAIGSHDLVGLCLEDIDKQTPNNPLTLKTELTRRGAAGEQMGETIRPDLQERMAPGVVITHQARGWLAQRKRMFKEDERRPGTFLVLKATGSEVQGCLAVFLAVEDEATMQATSLPFLVGSGECRTRGSEISLPDGHRMVFQGGHEAAVSFIGAFILAQT